MQLLEAVTHPADSVVLNEEIFIMSKKFILASMLLFASAVTPSQSYAKDLTFSLDCEWDSERRAPVGAPKYQVMKTAYKDKNGKWAIKYSLREQPLNPTAKSSVFDLEPAGSGDEDYSEYYVVDPSHKSAISGAYIQFQFTWASLVDNKGYHSYDCRKSNR